MWKKENNRELQQIWGLFLTNVVQVQKIIMSKGINPIYFLFPALWGIVDCSWRGLALEVKSINSFIFGLGAIVVAFFVYVFAFTAVASIIMKDKPINNTHKISVIEDKIN